MKRLIVLACMLLLVWCVGENPGGIFAAHMYDGMLSQKYEAPYHVVNWYVFWGPFHSTDTTDTVHVDTCAGCDTTAALTRVVDTSYTVWMPMPIYADGYVFLCRITHQDTMFGVDSTESVTVDLQCTNNHTATTPTVYTTKAGAATSLADTTTTAKYLANPDSFVVGTFIWGTHVRGRITRTIWPDSAGCIIGCYTSDTTLYDKSEIEMKFLPLDRY